MLSKICLNGITCCYLSAATYLFSATHRIHYTHPTHTHTYTHTYIHTLHTYIHYIHTYITYPHTHTDRDEMEYHVENLCSKKGTYFSRKIFCPVGCGLRLMRRDIIEHVSYYCVRRLADCPFKCGQSVQFDKLRNHLYFCPRRPICCEPGAKQCTKLFFKWFYCDGNPGDLGGQNFDGRAPDGTPHYGGALPKVGHDMLGLFAEDGEYEVDANRLEENGSVTDISLLKGDEEAQAVPLQITSGVPSSADAQAKQAIRDRNASRGFSSQARTTADSARFGANILPPFSSGDGKGAKAPMPKVCMTV